MAAAPGTESPPTEQALNESLAFLFSTENDVNLTAPMEELSIAFLNLVGIFLSQRSCKALLPHVRLDPAGFEQMMRRFHRDAFGIYKFGAYVDGLIGKGKLDAGERVEMMRRVCNLGVRIHSEAPRKTRIAAAFSLWMCTFRPIFFQDTTKLGFSNDTLASLPGSINYWIATRYLKLFGKVELPSNDAGVLLERIKHDFAFRAVNLSSLEMLYASIFRA